MAKASKPPGQYAVGYGRPPGHSRYNPGECGSPAGRQKGQPTVSEIFRKEAARLVKIKRGDTIETITKYEAIIRRLLQAAMEGDTGAARLALRPRPERAPTHHRVAMGGLR
jgi:Family of unknown function (DUF5681)